MEKTRGLLFEDCRIETATDYNSSYLVLQRDDNGEGDWKEWHLEIPRLISKEYGFIEWLLEKNKIDRDELYHEMNGVVYYNHYEGEIIKEYSDSDGLIMLLSIQNEPIKFLLKNIKTEG